MEATAAEKPRAVTIKGWGTLYVRPLTVAEVEEGQEIDAGSKDKRNLARGAARLICDEDGGRLFDPANAEDVELLARQGWNRLRRVLEAADDDVKAAVEGN